MNVLIYIAICLAFYCFGVHVGTRECEENLLSDGISSQSDRAVQRNGDMLGVDGDVFTPPQQATYDSNRRKLC